MRRTLRRLKKNAQSALVQDFGIIALSVVVAILLARTNAIIDLLDHVNEYQFVGSFIAGMFFTSAFTTAPAIVTLGEIAQSYSLFLTAIAGGAGAVIGDLIIFSFVKDRFSEHLMQIIGQRGRGRRFKMLLGRRSSRWLTFIVGGLILASPLPDELGVGIMGFSKIKTSRFMLLSFIFNALGIVLVGLAARMLAA